MILVLVFVLFGCGFAFRSSSSMILIIFSFPVNIYYMYFYMSHLTNMLDTRNVTYSSSDGRRDVKVNCMTCSVFLDPIA